MPTPPWDASSPSTARSCASRSRRCNCRMFFDAASGYLYPRTVILPGATLGLLGGGQLGRMFTVAARTLGYGVTVLDPDALAPAAEFATAHLKAPYDDSKALAELARTCEGVTTEFENAPADALDAIASRVV